MANSLNRRNWIKSSALMAGGLALASGTLNKLAAMPVIKKLGLAPKTITDETVLLQAPPAMKARLLANENPFGPSAAAKKAIADSLDTSYQYAFMQMSVLGGKIAQHEGISQGNIMLNSGSTPLLHAAAMHYSKGGKNI